MTLNKLNKLNGWQRLFVAFVALIYLPLAVLFFPSEPWIPKLTDQELNTLMPEDVKSEINKGHLTVSSGVRTLDWNDLINGNSNERKSFYVEIGTFTDWKYNLYFSNTNSKKDELVASFQNALISNYEKKVIYEQLIFILYAVLIPIFTYLVGLTISWVIKGFRTND